MITIIYNEQRIETEDNISIAHLLENQKIDHQNSKGLAVACNFSVLPKNQWKKTFLKDGDQIDVLQAIQGG